MTRKQFEDMDKFDLLAYCQKLEDEGHPDALAAHLQGRRVISHLVGEWAEGRQEFPDP